MKPSVNSKTQSVLSCIALLLFVLLHSNVTHAQQKKLPAHPVPKLLNAHIPDSIDHFVSNKKPLAKNQDVLLAKQFFKHLITLPVEAWRCSVALYKKQTFPQLLQNKEVFDVFKLLRYRNEKKDFCLDFENHSAEYEKVCDTKHGVCQGITNLDRRMNMLAYYDYKNVLGAKIPPESKPEERFKFYEKLVKQILNDRPTIIPGFEDLLSFSRDRIGKRVLLEASVKVWASENATIPGITQVLRGRYEKVDPGEARSLYTKVKARLSLNYNPILYLTTPHTSDLKWIHVMQATDVSANKDGTYTIYLKDPNVPLNIPGLPETAANRKTGLEISKDGKMSYMDMPLSEVDFMPGDDMEISRILVNTIAFCKKNPLFCVEGGKF